MVPSTKMKSSIEEKYTKDDWTRLGDAVESIVEFFTALGEQVIEIIEQSGEQLSKLWTEYERCLRENSLPLDSHPATGGRRKGIRWPAPKVSHYKSIIIVQRKGAIRIRNSC